MKEKIIWKEVIKMPGPNGTMLRPWVATKGRIFETNDYGEIEETIVFLEKRKGKFYEKM